MAAPADLAQGGGRPGGAGHGDTGGRLPSAPCNPQPRPRLLGKPVCQGQRRQRPRPRCVRSDRGDRGPATPDGAAPGSKRRRGHRREWTNSRMASLTFPSAPDLPAPQNGGAQTWAVTCFWKGVSSSVRSGCPSAAPVPANAATRCWDGGDTGEAAARWRGLNPSLLLLPPGAQLLLSLSLSVRASASQAEPTGSETAAAGGRRLRGALPLSSAHGGWPGHVTLTPSQHLPPPSPPRYLPALPAGRSPWLPGCWSPSGRCARVWSVCTPPPAPSSLLTWHRAAPALLQVRNLRDFSPRSRRSEARSHRL